MEYFGCTQQQAPTIYFLFVFLSLEKPIFQDLMLKNTETACHYTSTFAS